MTLNKNKLSTRSNRRARGQATVELAIIVPFLALLLVGIADVARIYSEQLAVVHAAGVGARWLTLPEDYQPCSRYNNVTEAIVADLNQAVRTDDIVVQTSVVYSPYTVTSVKITYRHDFLFGLIKNVPTTFTGAATWAGGPTTTDPNTGCAFPEPNPLAIDTQVSTNH
jgi:Flp pilus assembly protein TadG